MTIIIILIFMTANKFWWLSDVRDGAQQCRWGRHFSLSKFHSSLSNLLHRPSWGTYQREAAACSHNPYTARS